MFKVKDNTAPEIMKELFAPKMSPYDLRNNNSFKRRVYSVWNGTESVSYLQSFGKYIWNLLGFTENLDLKYKFNVAFSLFSTR